MRRYILLLSVFVSLSTLAQTDTLTFTGVVFNRLTLEQLNEAIYIKNGSTYGVSEGRFNIKSVKGDTIVFSHLGFKDLIVVLEDTLANKEYLMGIYLSPEPTLLSEVIIVPRYYSLKALVASDPVKQSRDQANAERNLKLAAYQGLKPQEKMDYEMNQKMTLHKHRMDVEYKTMINPDQMVGVNFVNVVPDTKAWMEGLRDKGLSLDLGSITTVEEVSYLQRLFKAMEQEKAFISNKITGDTIVIPTKD